MGLLQDGCLPEDPPQNLIDYVNGFRLKLYRAGELAKQKLEIAQRKMKNRYDQRAEVRQFSPGDPILALLPLVDSPFQVKYSGPFSVVRQVSDLNYLIETPGRRKSTRPCHVNLLKPYRTRESVFSVQQGSPLKPVLVAGPVLASTIPNPVGVESEEEEIV